MVEKTLRQINSVEKKLENTAEVERTKEEQQIRQVAEQFAFGVARGIDTWGKEQIKETINKAKEKVEDVIL